MALPRNTTPQPRARKSKATGLDIRLHQAALIKSLADGYAEDVVAGDLGADARHRAEIFERTWAAFRGRADAKMADRATIVRLVVEARRIRKEARAAGQWKPADVAEVRDFVLLTAVKLGVKADLPARLVEAAILARPTAASSMLALLEASGCPSTEAMIDKLSRK